MIELVAVLVLVMFLVCLKLGRIADALEAANRIDRERLDVEDFAHRLRRPDEERKA